jgi:hypothetical protein
MQLTAFIVIRAKAPAWRFVYHLNHHPVIYNGQNDYQESRKAKGLEL